MKSGLDMACDTQAVMHQNVRQLLDALGMPWRPVAASACRILGSTRAFTCPQP
jgi:hypothetical protein